MYAFMLNNLVLKYNSIFYYVSLILIANRASVLM